MRICHTVFQPLPAIESWQMFEWQFPSIPALLLAQQEAGLQVTWLALSQKAAEFSNKGVQVKLLEIGAGINRPRKNHERIMQALQTMMVDVVHQHGLNSLPALNVLASWAKMAEGAVVLQDHGGGIPQVSMKKTRYLRAMLNAKKIVFGNEKTMNDWFPNGEIRRERLALLFAASSPFSAVAEIERAAIRRKHGMHGKPIFGWVAHLDKNKDPLTALQAMAVYFEDNPDARLYMHFIKDKLRPECEQVIASSTTLSNRVFLLGHADHTDLESFYRAIDYLVQGSHDEAYGFSVAEAMSTGVVPIVTDIPSFRLLTRGGEFGHLFRPGDTHQLTGILQALPVTVRKTERQRITGYFDEQWSYPALAQKWKKIYAEALA